MAMKVSSLPGSFDILGDIAILEIPEERKQYEKMIAGDLVKRHPHLKTVYVKEGVRSGELRLRKLRKVWGNGAETVHKEHGYLIKLDVEKCYFSIREGTERQRIAEQVMPGEEVLVMFSGVAPFGVAIAKRQPRVGHVYCMEKNREAHRYAEENVKLNRMKYQVVPVCGDAEKKSGDFYGRMDRVVMPLPKEGYKFLPLALKCLKPRGGVIHFYYVSTENDLFGLASRIVQTQARIHGRKAKITGQRKVLPYGPRTFKICIDFEAR